MWKYKGTKEFIKKGDIVQISKSIATQNSVANSGKVVDLRGFITVELSDGTNIDLDARSIVKKIS